MKILYPFLPLTGNEGEPINDERLRGDCKQRSRYFRIGSTCNFTKGFCLLLATCFFLGFTLVADAQGPTNADSKKNPVFTQTFTARYFINNIVDIGLSDFGVITAEDSANIYFIAVRRALAEKDAYPERILPSIRSVKFYNGAYKAKATRIDEAVFGAFKVVLYQSPKPPESKWQTNFYHSLAFKKGKLSTFRDKWVSDQIWSIHSAKIEIMKQPKGGLTTLRVPKDAGIAKGMPVVNDEGFIAGIFAESSLGKTVVTAISMEDIAEAFYKSKNDCSYFSMVEWGKDATRCVLEERARLALEEKAKLAAEERAKKSKEELAKEEADRLKDSLDAAAKAAKAARKVERKTRFFEYGIHGNFLPGPLQVENPEQENYLKTRIYSVGLSLHFNLDKNRSNRITLKPRYGDFYERNNPGIWATPDDQVRIVGTNYQYAELPVVFERQLFRARKYSMALGVGYAPGWVFNHKYTWVDKPPTVYTDERVTVDKSAIRHRLLGEFHFYEFRLARLSAVYARDISKYPNSNFVLSHGGTDYTPFAARKDAWYLGLEIEIRLRK